MQALTTAEVDKVDLMQFQVLNTGDIVYEPPGPPPPLFEDPSIIKVRLMCILSCVSAYVSCPCFFTHITLRLGQDTFLSQYKLCHIIYI